MPLKVALIQIVDIGKAYEIFFQMSGIAAVDNDEAAKKRFIHNLKSPPKPLYAPYPLGILALAAYARERLKGKVEIHIIDMMQRRMSVDDLMPVLDKISPDVVGLSSMSAYANALHTIAMKVKERHPACKVIAGGAYCSASPLRAAADGNLDCVAYGEAEETFVEILKNVLGKRSLKGIAGTAHAENAKAVMNTPCRLIEDLDSLPYPAFDLIDIDGYWGSMSPLGKAAPWMLLFNSRGCPYQCLYCHQIFGKRTRFMSVKRTLDEIMFYNKRYGIREFHVWDDIFNLDVPRGIALSREIVRKKRSLRFLYLGGLRADIMDETLLDEMINAGCCYISYAVETASPRVQKLIKKYLKLGRAAAAINFTADKGVWVNTYNMLGFPTETKEEMRMTIDYNIAQRHHSMRIFKVIPQEGTGLYELASRKRKKIERETDVYTDYSDLYDTDLTKEDFDGLLRYAWRGFYLNAERLERSIDMRSRTLSEAEIKRICGIELLNAMMNCGIRTVDELDVRLRPLALRAFEGLSNLL